MRRLTSGCSWPARSPLIGGRLRRRPAALRAVQSGFAAGRRAVYGRRTAGGQLSRHPLYSGQPARRGEEFSLGAVPRTAASASLESSSMRPRQANLLRSTKAGAAAAVAARAAVLNSSRFLEAEAGGGQ